MEGNAMKYSDFITKTYPFVVKARRSIHSHPELRGEEEATVAFITKELAADGIEYVVVPNGGVLAFIEGKKGDGATLLLRADIDALPIQESETNNGGFKKKVLSGLPGKSHVCGHDGHTAILLGAAKILNQLRDEFHGKAVLMFERGEEGGGNLVYLLKYIMEQNIHIDASWGLHVNTDLEVGKIGINYGPVFANFLGFAGTIRGVGGHGSRPDEANSPIDCFVALYNAIQTIRMKQLSPFNPATFSIGTLHAGTRNNTVPSELTFSGTWRLFSREDYHKVLEATKLIYENISKTYGCTIEPQWELHELAVVNDMECAKFAHSVLGEALGSDRVVTVQPIMGSEDFANICTLWPGVFGQLGIRNEEMGITAPVHNPKFDMDEAALETGLAATVQYAVSFLNAPVDTSKTRFQGTPHDLYVQAGERNAHVFDE